MCTTTLDIPLKCTYNKNSKEDAMPDQTTLSSVQAQGLALSAAPPSYGVAYIGTEDAQGKLVAAIVVAQLNFEQVVKRATGRAGNSNFSYSTLSALVAATRPALLAEGVLILTPIGMGPDGQHRVSAVLMGHGARMESHVDYTPSEWDSRGGKMSPQTYGLITTYLRRYLLQGLLGIEGDKDEDDASVGAHRAPAAAKPQSAATPVRMNGMSADQRSAISELMDTLGLDDESKVLAMRTFTGKSVSSHLTAKDADTLIGSLRAMDAKKLPTTEARCAYVRTRALSAGIGDGI